MSGAAQPSGWPNRPQNFYVDWTIFCTAVLSEEVREAEGSDALATALLAGSAVLGATGLAAVVDANRDIIDEAGLDWGINNLSSILMGGAVVLGGALGGFGGAWLKKMLTSEAQRGVVDDLQRQLALARREFEELLQDRRDGLINEYQHKAAVEHLFNRLLAVSSTLG